MKFTLFLSVVLIVSQLSAQNSENDFQFPFSVMVVDGVQVASDFFVINSMIYEKYTELNEMMYSKYKFNLTTKEKAQFKNHSYYNNPYCNLFNNKRANFKYSIKQIDIKAKNNFPFEKGSIKILKFHNDTGYFNLGDTIYSPDSIFNVKSSFLSIIKEALNLGKLTVYEPNIEYNNLKKQDDLIKKIDTNFHRIRYIRVKEAVYYDYSTHCYKPFILAVGLLIDDKQFWFYGPELRRVLTLYSVDRYSYNYYDYWDKILENGMYESKIIYESNTQIHQELQRFPDNDINNGLHRNEYDCYWNLHQLKIAHFNKANIQYPHRFTISPQLNGTIDYKDSLHRVILKIEFDHGVANGSYSSFYTNGKKKQTGTFIHEKKHGEWISYYPSGNLMAKRNFSYGLPKGKQLVYYDTRKVLMKYNYENGMLNGDFIRFDEKGKLLEKGTFKDDLIIGEWEVNYHIPDHYMKLITENPDYGWEFPVDEIKNQTLSYKVEFEQYNRGIGYYERGVRFKQ
ncbi:MAG: hypothetical protein P8N07_11800 [Flavobacteriales bacterium]|nr:hypothetical protein [Flavobacteriales bacterium]MDG1176461.1 hypothetical protein [Flavobacteriales bacterium]